MEEVELRVWWKSTLCMDRERKVEDCVSILEMGT